MNAQGLDGYIQTNNQKIYAPGFPGVKPGIESLRYFYQAFGLYFPGHKC